MRTLLPVRHLALLLALALLWPGLLHAQAAPLAGAEAPPATGPASEAAVGAPPGSRSASATAAPLLPNCPPERDLCVEADRTGGIDLKTGVARLEGNVRGVLRSRQLKFRAESVVAYRDGGKNWNRIVLDQHVQVSQRNQESDADHGVLTPNDVRLSGNVRMMQQDLRIAGDQAELRPDGSRSVVRGDPMTLVVNKALLAESPPSPANGKAGPTAKGNAAKPVASPKPTTALAGPVTTTLQAEQVIIEGTPKHAELNGNVRVVQSDGRLTLHAQQVILDFALNSKLKSFRAQGHVRITQPERRIAADFAQSGEDLKTILLVGNATMQQTGQFELKSQRMVVYADASKGIMQSNNEQKPITLSMDLSQPTYRLTEDDMLKLGQKNVPAPVLAKLTPLIGQAFSTRDAFKKEVSGRLTQTEASSYLNTIVDVARQRPAAQ